MGPTTIIYMDGLMQKRRNSIAFVIEFLHFCIKPLSWSKYKGYRILVRK